MSVTRTRLLVLTLTILTLLLFAQEAAAYSGFPNAYYPGNQYGIGSTYYTGPWGERMVYGGYGYFPNPYGYRPYGYRAYGSFYTPQDLRYGRASRAYW